nr:MAG TPA: hypothetical protein [Caudoviricetes sp.]
MLFMLFALDKMIMRLGSVLHLKYYLILVI